MDSLARQLALIDGSSFTNDEPGRKRICKAAAQLTQRLERPYERVLRMVYTEPYHMAAVKTAIEMGLFKQLNGEAQSSSKLAKATGADVELISRLLRILGSCGWVQEVTEDAFVGMELSLAAVEDSGMARAIGHYFDVVATLAIKLPSFLGGTGYRNPSDYSDSPFSHVMGSPDPWKWMEHQPQAQSNLNGFLGAMRSKKSPWIAYYSVDDLLQDFDRDRPLIVDVGGGTGNDLMHVAASLPESYGDARLILQDTQAVIQSIDQETLAPQISPIAHDFFTPQPPNACGAKVYFLRQVLHDWPDKEALQILAHLKAAMKPGYSRVIVLETIMPTRVAETSPLEAALDLHMMMFFGALERTEQQWSQLFRKAGLTYMGMRFCGGPDKNQGILEAACQ